MDFNQLTPLDKLILESFAEGLRYKEVQERLKDQMNIQLDNRKLGYRIDTLKKKFDCGSHLELGYKYGVHTAIVELKTTKKKSFANGYAVGVVMWTVAILMIWYFTMFA